MIFVYLAIGFAAGCVFAIAWGIFHCFGTMKIDRRGPKDNILFDVEKDVNRMMNQRIVIFKVKQIKEGRIRE